MPLPHDWLALAGGVTRFHALGEHGALRDESLTEARSTLAPLIRQRPMRRYQLCDRFEQVLRPLRLILRLISGERLNDRAVTATAA